MKAMKIANSEDPLRIEAKCVEESPEDVIQRLEMEKSKLKEQLTGLMK